MPKSVFERKFQRDIKRVNKRLRTYIDDPESNKNIHDVRVSIRKLDIVFSLLSKKIRMRHGGKIERYREFLKANSSARDCDIIAGHLATLGAYEIGDLENKKKAELSRAAKLARSLKKLPPGLADMPDVKRVDKIANSLVARIEGTLPLVLSDGNRVEELHRMRRDLRKLRHVLNVVPARSRKMFMKKLSKATGRKMELEEMSDLLGSIHDCDITIEYLKGKTDSKQLLKEETSNRELLYQKFIRYVER
jgi:CHAD domain-containing protein